jgi:phage tail-like protein
VSPAGRLAARGTLPGLASPHPLAATLPSLFQEDFLAQRFCAALDDVLAPVTATLDCLPAYLDPALTPPDVLDWLAGWVGLDLAVQWPVERRRLLVARAAELHAWRGTAYAVRELVELATGIVPELEDSGGATWSREPQGRLPGRRTPELVVRLYAPADGAPDPAVLTRIVALVAPAHLSWRVEVVTLG